MGLVVSLGALALGIILWVIWEDYQRRRAAAEPAPEPTVFVAEVPRDDPPTHPRITSQMIPLLNGNAMDRIDRRFDRLERLVLRVGLIAVSAFFMAALALHVLGLEPGQVLRLMRSF